MIKLDMAHRKFIETLRNDGKSDATVVAYNKDIQQLTEHLIGTGVVLVSEIKLEHVEAFMSDLTGKNYTAKSVSRKTNAARTFLKYLHKSGHLIENISDLLKHPKFETKAPRILTKMEYRALRDAARADSRTFAMIEVLLQTGVTISELAELKVKDFEIIGDGGILHVGKKQSHGARTVPLNKAVVEAVRNYIENDRPNIEGALGLFITKTGKSLLIRNIRSTIDRCFKLAGISKAKVNDLRHTFVAHHLMAGVNMAHLSKIAGHKRVSTTEKYLQYIEKVEITEKTELGIL